MRRSAHLRRLDDLDRCAALGLSAIRQPVSWEITQRDEKAWPDWALAEPGCAGSGSSGSGRSSACCITAAARGRRR
jgi:hypothetical protein